MGTPNIESYRFGHIVIDGEAHDRDVIILPNGIRGNWWRKEGHALHPGDLTLVFEADPSVLIVGQGAHGRMRITVETRQALAAAGIEMKALPTEEACRTYNDLREKRSTAAALHLTC